MDLGYTFMISLGQGGPWKEILGEPVKWLYPTEMVVDLGIHLYGFLGPGWILDRKEILGEPVKWLYSKEMVVDLDGPWNTSLWFPWA